MRSEVHINKNTIRENQKPYVIAEIGNNHLGSVNLAKEMIRVAALCGVDAVKFQKRCNEVLYTKSFYDSEYTSVNSFAETYGEHRDYLELSKDDFDELIECARESNVDIIITVFDKQSLIEMQNLDFDAYKIASGDITNIPLIEAVAQLNKPVILSTGYCDYSDIDRAIRIIKKYTNELVLMYCVSQYPTADENLNLNLIREYMKKYNSIPIGFSSHENGILASCIACSMGAVAIERHFTVAHQLKGTDQVFSLDATEMKRMIDSINRTMIMLGKSKEKHVNGFEQIAAEKLRKGIYTSRSIKKGEVIHADDLCIKSPGSALEPYFIHNIIGSKAYKDMEEEEAFTREQLNYAK